MGSFYSFIRKSSDESSNIISNESQNSPENNLKEPILEFDSLDSDVSVFEAEYLGLFKKISISLDNLENTPCKSISLKVMACLKENPGEMGNCLPSMEYYQMCVEDARIHKLDGLVYEE